MGGQIGRVAWYRLRTSFARRLGGYASIVLLVGLAGGIGMGSLAAARRTQSSFSVFLKSTNPSDLTLTQLYGPNLSADLAKLPGVERVEAANDSLTGFALAESERRPDHRPPSRSAAARAYRQHQRRVLRPGPSRRNRGPPGRSEAKRRVRRHRGGGSAGSLARGESLPDGLLHHRPERAARLRHRQGQAGGFASR